jgi:hypothetical protein
MDIDVVETPEDVAKKSLTEFLARVTKRRERENKLIQWHLDAFTDGGVELPGTVDATWIDCTKYEYDAEYNSTINVPATLAFLSAATKYAKSRGCEIKKKYDETDFEVMVTLPKAEDGSEPYAISMRYYARRTAVCERKVVGQKVIPASVIDERIEDVVEWECKPISLLGFDAAVDAASA